MSWSSRKRPWRKVGPQRGFSWDGCLGASGLLALLGRSQASVGTWGGRVLPGALRGGERLCGVLSPHVRAR